MSARWNRYVLDIICVVAIGLLLFDLGGAWAALVWFVVVGVVNVMRIQDQERG